MSEHKPSYYAIIPANVRYCKGIPSTAKLLYGEITALCQKEGYCWANNAYFESLYEVEKRTVQLWLQALQEKGFITIEIDQAAGNERKIWITTPTDKNVPTPSENFTTPDEKNYTTPSVKNYTHSITSTNTTSKREKEKFNKKESSDFLSKGKIRMTCEEYDKLREDNPDLDVSALCYRASDWLASEGKTKKDYAAFMRNWIKTHREYLKRNPPQEKDRKFAPSDTGGLLETENWKAFKERAIQ